VADQTSEHPGTHTAVRFLASDVVATKGTVVGAVAGCIIEGPGGPLGTMAGRTIGDWLRQTFLKGEVIGEAREGRTDCLVVKVPGQSEPLLVPVGRVTPLASLDSGGGIAPGAAEPATPPSRPPAEARAKVEGMSDVQLVGSDAVRRELPRLLREVPGKWIAYRGEQQVALADSAREAYAQFTRANIPLDEVVVLRVEPLAPPLDLRRIRRVGGVR